MGIAIASALQVQISAAHSIILLGSIPFLKRARWLWMIYAVLKTLKYDLGKSAVSSGKAGKRFSILLTQAPDPEIRSAHKNRRYPLIALFSCASFNSFRP